MADMPPASMSTQSNAHREHTISQPPTQSSTTSSSSFGIRPRYTYTSTRMVPSIHASSATAPSASPHSSLDYHLPSRPPAHGRTVKDWLGAKKPLPVHIKRQTASSPQNQCDQSPSGSGEIEKDDAMEVESTEDDGAWRDVYRNIKCMDQLYDATFYSWLKSEDNVHSTAQYLHTIVNEYPLVRVINAFKWLISDWRLESISTLVCHVTVDWPDEVGDLRRAHLLRHLTHSWATQYTAALITMVLSSAPYASSTPFQRESFLRSFTQDWDFSKLSEFFMYLQSPDNIDYKVKCVMLQEAARREREALGAKMNRKKRVAAAKSSASDHATPMDTAMATDDVDCSLSVSSSTEAIASTDTTTTSITGQTSSDDSHPGNASTTTRRHHRRTSSNDVNDIKRLRLSTPDLDQDTHATDVITSSPPLSPSSASVSYMPTSEASNASASSVSSNCASGSHVASSPSAASVGRGRPASATATTASGRPPLNGHHYLHDSLTTKSSDPPIGYF